MKTSLTLLLIVALTPAAALAGSITGKVEATPAKYLEESVVYLKEVKGTYPAKKVPLDQKGMKFTPHVLVITQGDTVSYLNHDAVGHNVFSPDNEGYNLGVFKGGEAREHLFANAGVYSQLCSVHPEMLGFVFVGQNPYAAAVDATGRFTIDQVPPGTYQLAIWNSHLKAPDQTVTVSESQPTEAKFSLKR